MQSRLFPPRVTLVLNEEINSTLTTRKRCSLSRRPLLYRPQLLNNVGQENGASTTSFSQPPIVSCGRVHAKSNG